MKIIIYVLLAVIVVMLFVFAFPQSCNKKLYKAETKKSKSLVIDSIVSEQTRKHNAILDSIIKVHKKSDSILKANNNTLYIKYCALRALMKPLQLVYVSSANQVVNGVPAIAYNASIKEAMLCDSLLANKDSELSVKDSIILAQEIQKANDAKEITAKEQAKQDLISLDELKTKKLKHAKSLNKKIPLIAGIAAGLGFLLAIIALK